MSESSSSPAAATLPFNPLALAGRFWLVLLVAVVVVGSTVHWFRNAFDDRGYAPEQPIAYSHKQHAGQLGIDCRYCHSNAEHGKHPGLPSMEVCMGCHNHVATDKPEIQKMAKIAKDGVYFADARGRIVDEKTPGAIRREGGVIHWNRVHRLPDHVYFSHQWHVKAGVACQTCHGPVEEMTVLRQHADLTMAWCLECHRRDNYVSSPTAKPEDFAIGSADYAAIVDRSSRQEADAPVVFKDRRTAGGEGADHGHGSAHSHAHEAHGPAPAPVTFSAKLAKLYAERPELKRLPSWRVADLPESHRRFYVDLASPDGTFDPRQTMMNAPTQCSTCHQ